MWIDERAEFCDAASTSGASGSTALVGDVMDLTSNRDIGQGHPLYLVIQVPTAASGGTSLQFVLASDGVEAIAIDGNSTKHFLSDVFTTAELVAGFALVVPLPMGNAGGVAVTSGYERYLGILVTDVATVTASINAFLTPDPHGWQSSPDGNN